MKRLLWIGLAGMVVTVLVLGAWSAFARNGEPGQPPDLNGLWEFKGRWLFTTVDGERQRQRVEGTISVSQQYPSIYLYFDPPGVEYSGATGERFLSAAAGVGGQGPGGLSILDARVSRNGQRLSGRIKGVSRDGVPYDYFYTMSFTAARAREP